MSALVGVAWSAGQGGLYRDAPPNGHTGGFDEPTCHRCHFDRQLNDVRGAIEIRGVPDNFRRGERYEMQIVMEHPEMRRGGFQVSARFGGGPDAGRQAGLWSASPRSDLRLSSDSAGVVFVTHGVPAGMSGRVVWNLSWQAPRSGDRVVFHVAGNASNDDNSEFGDFILLRSRETAASRSEPE